MIKTIAASQGAKLVAACVCPVAGSVAVTMAVPQVREAVHRATTPRAYALPKTRVRQPDAPSAAPVQTAMAAPPCEPVLTAAALNNPATPLAFETPSLGRMSDLPQLASRAPLPVGGGSGVPFLVTPPGGPVFPGVPEPTAWVQMLVGFGLIGGAARYALRQPALKAAPPEA
ncbi:PEPxxWA-CTERM sorting domain-containing protein [Sphingomonas quercus]|uniref:PEPxxWA-CTERM sorting domain-containing protein n=1 Tax=Sphingomonas quercus TaxID=2842451 RepID=A0ABS6BHC0_9SPHN|nr:PEPxxWA-CTERM sorting domain-containing protein [Sphingomonas quercus]MBU3077202.1 PEPxxWA-CTERM sorting domain-containing protein [Sphingomonas quercus]